MTPIRIRALVDEQERHGIVSGLEQLHECLTTAAPTDAPSIKVRFDPPGTATAASPEPNVVILSLFPELRAAGQEFRETTERWAGYVQRARSPGAAVFVCTLFRHVDIRGRPDLRPILVERIRRLNLMAVNLSQEFGIGVVDVDRAMAHFGGRNLGSDFRLSGDLAADVAGHTLAWCLLSYGLDDLIDPAIQERARIALGGLHTIPEILLKRQSARKYEGSSHG
jgi:hypothetical protein